MHAILTNICEGRGEPEDIELLSSLARFMTTASLCGLGGTAGNPVLSTIRYFKNEYESHIIDKKCRAGVCKNLFSYEIDEDTCTGCTLCAVKCPEKAMRDQEGTARNRCGRLCQMRHLLQFVQIQSHQGRLGLAVKTRG